MRFCFLLVLCLLLLPSVHVRLFIYKSVAVGLWGEVGWVVLRSFVRARLALGWKRRPRSLSMVLCEDVSALLPPIFHSFSNMVGL